MLPACLNFGHITQKRAIKQVFGWTNLLTYSCRLQLKSFGGLSVSFWFPLADYLLDFGGLYGILCLPAVKFCRSRPWSRQKIFYRIGNTPSNETNETLHTVCTYGGFIKGILRGVRCTKSLRALFLHRRPPSWTTLVLYSRAVFIFNEPAFRNCTVKPVIIRWSACRPRCS